MSLLLQLLVAAAIIAAFILLRLFTDRAVLRSRMHKGRGDNECREAGCLRGCGASGGKPQSTVPAGERE